MQTCDFLNMLFTPAILKGVFQWKGKNSILTINHTNHKRLWGTYKRVVPKEEEWLACVDQLMILFCLWCEQIWWNYGKQFEITFFYYVVTLYKHICICLLSVTSLHEIHLVIVQVYVFTQQQSIFSMNLECWEWFRYKLYDDIYQYFLCSANMFRYWF